MMEAAGSYEKRYLYTKLHGVASQKSMLFTDGESWKPAASLRIVGGGEEGRFAISMRRKSEMSEKGCVRGGPNQPLHRDLQWSIVLLKKVTRMPYGRTSHQKHNLRLRAAIILKCILDKLDWTG
jgi:hypothetical protein